MRQGHSIDRRRSSLLAALVTLLAVAGCGSEKCVVKTTQFTTSVSSVGTGGDVQGLPIARFDMVQDFVSHEPYEACAQGPLQDVGVVRLNVTSVASKPVRLVFEVQGLNSDGIPKWFHRDSIDRLMPNQTVNAGTVGSSPTHLDEGARVILILVTVLS